MAIQTEVWARDIAEKLFPENSFMAQSVNESIWVENKTVHRPQAGALPEVKRNRTSFPAGAVTRTDTDNSYDIDEFTSTPTVIRDIEETETSYAKRASVLSGHHNELNRQIANWMAYKWAPTNAGSILRTTGEDRVANLVGATGNRKKLTIDDIIAAKAMLDDLDIPMEGRNILLPAHMYNDLISDNKKELLGLDMTGEARMKNGKLTQLMNFNIFLRGKKNVLNYTNAATPVLRTPDAAALTTANAAALIWHKDFVGRAQGSVKVFPDYDVPGYYGSIFSALARAGGQKIYSDGLGVISIVEAAGA